MSCWTNVLTSYVNFTGLTREKKQHTLVCDSFKF